MMKMKMNQTMIIIILLIRYHSVCSSSSPLISLLERSTQTHVNILQPIHLLSIIADVKQAHTYTHMD